MLGAFEYVIMTLLKSKCGEISSFNVLAIFLRSSVVELFGWCGMCIYRSLLIASLSLLGVGLGCLVTMGIADFCALMDCFLKIGVSDESVCPRTSILSYSR